MTTSDLPLGATPGTSPKLIGPGLTLDEARRVVAWGFRNGLLSLRPQAILIPAGMARRQEGSHWEPLDPPEADTNARD